MILPAIFNLGFLFCSVLLMYIIGMEESSRPAQAFTLFLFLGAESVYFAIISILEELRKRNV